MAFLKASQKLTPTYLSNTSYYYSLQNLLRSKTRSQFTKLPPLLSHFFCLSRFFCLLQILPIICFMPYSNGTISSKQLLPMLIKRNNVSQQVIYTSRELISHSLYSSLRVGTMTLGRIFSPSLFSYKYDNNNSTYFTVVMLTIYFKHCTVLGTQKDLKKCKHPLLPLQASSIHSALTITGIPNQTNRDTQH